MDELEFRERIHADPFTEDADILAAAANNPDLARLRLELQGFDQEVRATMESTAIPADLMGKLLAIPATDTSTEAVISNIGKPDSDSGNLRPLQAGSKQESGSARDQQARSFYPYLALAASLVVAVGLTLSFSGNNSRPSATELAFGQAVLSHLYEDSDAAAAQTSTASLQLAAVSTVLDQVGVRLVSTEPLSQRVISFARPCVIIPSNQSAHLVMQTDGQTAINVFIINNSPVDNQFRITDDRYSGVVVPMAEGNMVLISEGNQNGEELDQYRELFDDNLAWSI